ncbi:MAG: HAMP domain-containing sensor histidine kinase [Bradyrhizobium sp.]
MSISSFGLTERLIVLTDWFIPAELRTSTANLWRARLFVITHFLGPFSAVAIFGYLYGVVEAHDAIFWLLCALCAAFWLMPIGLRLTGNLFCLAVISFCDLTFVSTVGAFFYGGVSSPFLPWLLCALLIGFFYLSSSPALVLVIFTSHLAAFSVSYLFYGGFPSRVPVDGLATVGMISVLCATLYSSMMAIYYTFIMTEQSALRQEIVSHLETAKKLRRAKRAAEAADNARAIFLAKMNHQLRTPLNAIIGYSEILLEEMQPNDNPEDEADLKIINDAGRHLLSLVSDVLYLPTADLDVQTEIAVRDVDLDRTVDLVVATCINLASKNGNTLVVDKPESLGFIETDETRLRQILINLLSNAGKFTKDGAVTLRAARLRREEGDQIVFAVQDTGIGIPEEMIQTLFTKFNRASAVTAPSHGGTGLGLAVSSELAQLLSGELSVESRVGEGSTFTLKIPAVPATFAVAA